jgi:glycosyltransferase involved in cell wall biosynthesis
MARETLLFISPRFLFPVDSGGKIRTTQILRGMHGGRFHIKLMSPADPVPAGRHRNELAQVCDEFDGWPAAAPGWLHDARRASYLLHSLPMPVRSDYSAAGARLVSRALAARPAVVVFDFLHSAVLAPAALQVPSVLFTHNVESEIFKRHIEVARGPLMRQIWRSQYRKMYAYERKSLGRFDVAVAVSQRDAGFFRSDYGTREPFVIPTGVDLDYFSHAAPQRAREVVFCGSMDWLANQDGVRFFMDEVWPLVIGQVPDAKMTVVGRAPPQAMVELARRRGYAWSFTGFVDDVRPVVRGAAVSVVPLRVGGGTRLKIFESMAMGPVVVSTTIGVEGLPVDHGTHCLIADDAATMAQEVVRLLRHDGMRHDMSRAARRHVEEQFGHARAARVFEAACQLAMERFGGAGGGRR